ncbi:hypothetical protein CAEBREN_02477 [Caenorhabditis brenneri]|uniref:F-box domain-containing protein n=1 Tax=Caenorhabditis brenneri TaxID=135651 RepID=G0NKU5_CAEBE|nr:hypothetical protein CAEBREN_02477 [Caenorhabditis brenneri]
MAQQTRYPFNFFAKMPDLALQNVTQIMETVDLIMLSDCSKRCAFAIRASRAPSAPMKILISRERIELYLGDKVWLFSTSRQIKNRGGVKTFNFKHLPVKSNTGNLLETVNHGSEESDFNAVISHILFIIPSATFSDLRLTENRFSQSSEYFDCSVALAGISQIENLMIGQLAELEREEQKKNAEKNKKLQPLL